MIKFIKFLFLASYFTHVVFGLILDSVVIFMITHWKLNFLSDLLFQGVSCLLVNKWVYIFRTKSLSCYRRVNLVLIVAHEAWQGFRLRNGAFEQISCYQSGQVDFSFLIGKESFDLLLNLIYTINVAIACENFHG